MRRSLANNAALIMNSATGRDLEDEFTADSLIELEDRLAGFLGAAL